MLTYCPRPVLPACCRYWFHCKILTGLQKISNQENKDDFLIVRKHYNLNLQVAEAMTPHFHQVFFI
jgi:hypothetical protein